MQIRYCRRRKTELPHTIHFVSVWNEDVSPYWDWKFVAIEVPHKISKKGNPIRFKTVITPSKHIAKWLETNHIVYDLYLCERQPVGKTAFMFGFKDKDTALWFKLKFC